MDNWMTIPTFEDGILRWIKMRNFEEGLRYKSLKGSRSGLFNYDAVAYNTGQVFVVKGEIAAMVLDERGLLACAPTGGEGMKLGKRYQKILALADCVVIGDNDPDPDVARETRKLAEERAQTLNAKLIFPPPQYKDVDEWILGDPSAVDVLAAQEVLA